MNEQLKGLLDLQKIDADIHFLADLQTKRPRELDKERDRLKQAQTLVDSIQADIKGLRMACDKGELAMKEHQARIEKLQIDLNGAKTNHEYQVLQDQIARIREQVAEQEEAVLEKFNFIDALNEQKAKADSQVADARAEFAKKEAEMNAFLSEVEEKIGVLRKGRDEKVAAVDPEALDVYERVLARYEDSALALVDGKICQGCYMSVTTQEINILMLGNDLVQCRNCQRILYLP